MTVRVALADDQPIAIEGLKQLLPPDKFKVVVTIENVSDLSTLVEKNRPDILVLESRLGGKDALKSLETIAEFDPTPQFIVFTAFSDSSCIARASALGCFDFIPKSSPTQDIVNAITNAADGKETPLDSLLIKARARMRSNSNNGETQTILTGREMQVLRHISMGLSNREVGKSLGISVETVKEHVQNILRKLNVNDRTQAAVWAVRQQLI
jgi:DNA-binding NarL/FixJ family response regulator